jgi:uncharacterized protein (TIGR02444 family)
VSLWDWATGAYARPGVEDLCLALQDEHGQCVGYLLWAVWAALNSRRVGPASLAEAAATARDWETTVLRPLRSVRRALKQPSPSVAAAARKGLRTRIKAEELSAERALLETLEARTPPPGDEAASLDQALRDAASAWGSLPPPVLLEALRRAFSAA